MDIYEETLEKIEKKTVTVEDINSLIAARKPLVESLPDVVGMNAERIRKKTSPGRKVASKAAGKHTTPDGISPLSSVAPKRGASGSHVDPTKTFRGRKACSESVELLKANWLSPETSWVPKDQAFQVIVKRLMVEPSLTVEARDWLYKLVY